MASLAVSLLAVWLPVVSPAATEVGVSELIEAGAEWQGEEVTVEGELVGDYGFRRDGWMWTQLNGDAYVAEPIAEGGVPVGGNSGIGIRMPVELAEGLGPPGRYGRRGPVIQTTGIWKWHDPDRQGESYLEVRSYRVLDPSRRMGEPPDWRVIGIGALLVASMPVLWPQGRERVTHGHDSHNVTGDDGR